MRRISANLAPLQRAKLWRRSLMRRMRSQQHNATSIRFAASRLAKAAFEAYPSLRERA